MTDDEIIEIVEDHVGMGHGAWDMVSSEDLVAGFRIALALATPAPAQPDPLHVANERGEGCHWKDCPHGADCVHAAPKEKP